MKLVVITKTNHQLAGGYPAHHLWLSVKAKLLYKKRNKNGYFVLSFRLKHQNQVVSD